MISDQKPQPFPLDYTQTLLSLLDILSALYAKLAKLLGPSPFPHASQHMLGLAPHPGVSYLFQSHAPASATDDALLNVALGTAGNINNANSGVLHSPPPSWTPALGELVLKVDGKFKVSHSLPFNGMGGGSFNWLGWENRKSSRCYSKTSMCLRVIVLRTSWRRSTRSCVMLAGGAGLWDLAMMRARGRRMTLTSSPFVCTLYQ